MAVYNYSRYKIRIDPESKKTQGLRVGDIVRRQYFDYPNLIYSLMAVIETGVDVIGEKESSYFIGGLIEGDEPKSGELLDFVRVTNLFDPNRSGALYLTASDSQAPFMDVIDGLAYEKSLCFPSMENTQPEQHNKYKYTCFGNDFLQAEYIKSNPDIHRIFRLTRNSTPKTEIRYGIKQGLDGEIENPQRLLISFKSRASKKLSDVPVVLGSAGPEIDGATTISVDTGWQYHLIVITAEYPKTYKRFLTIDLYGYLTNQDEWLEVAELNIIRQSDIAVFTDATKARVGKISGIADPVFGILDGYGAYFQHIYATRNVNIAGTLTAGDENGFSSTFYVGKIHKNVIQNSIDVLFVNSTVTKINDNSPVGIGSIWTLGKEVSMLLQTKDWRTGHLDKVYCFSFWAKSATASVLTLALDGYDIQKIEIPGTNNWNRYYAPCLIKEAVNAVMSMTFLNTADGVCVTAPQFESGKTPSQYQPTDGTLSYVEDYGAWFSKGGIGGTIQNPLLRLNEDGSISSRDKSFVINPDGTGHFASGRFRWTKDTITLIDVTIRWKDFDEETQESLLPKSVSLSGTNTFHYPDELEEVCDPDEITIYATENNIIPTSRKWQYFSAVSHWEELDGNNKDFLHLSPTGHYWEERNVLPIRYIATYKGVAYEDIFTVYKQFDGESAYSLYINSSRGLIFKNGVVSTTLTATIFKGGEEVTDKIPENNFKWLRNSGDSVSDDLWNSTRHWGKSIEISGNDVYRKAVFDCEVIISTK